MICNWCKCAFRHCPSMFKLLSSFDAFYFPLPIFIKTIKNCLWWFSWHKRSLRSRRLFVDSRFKSTFLNFFFFLLNNMLWFILWVVSQRFIKSFLNRLINLVLSFWGNFSRIRVYFWLKCEISFRIAVE